VYCKVQLSVQFYNTLFAAIKKEYMKERLFRDKERPEGRVYERERVQRKANRMYVYKTERLSVFERQTD
jgi:hypothetical protein